MNKPAKTLPAYLTHEELKKLIKGIRKDRHRLGIALMSYGGLRVSEMRTLRIGDLNLGRGFIKVTGKGNKERFVPLNSRLQRMLEEYLAHYGLELSQDSLLLGKTRSSWHYVVKKYSRLVLGREDIHCHTLRHSFATALYSNGVQIERISELLGHSRLDTTMIYAHLSMEHKRDAVMSLDDNKSKLISYLSNLNRKREYITVKNYSDLIGREKELKQLTGYLESGVSVVLYGPRGSGKSAILKKISNALYIHEFKKKPTLIKLILDSRNLSEEVYKESEKILKRLSIDELLAEIEKINKIVVIDDITDLSKVDRKTVSKLSERTVVIAATSRPADKKLFRTFIEVDHLKRCYTRQILSEMINMNDQAKKDNLINDVLHSSGENIKEAEYIINQMQLGKSPDEISSQEREANLVSVAPILLIFVLFFCAWVLKSYTTSMVAMSYAMLIVFRLVFMRFMFMPANRKRKQE